MNVIMRGTRGSIPVASPSTQRHGGNTTCIEIRTNAGEYIIIDAGSGLRALGDEIMAAGPASIALCFTHAHWDHLLGFPMFVPIFSHDIQMTIHAPNNIGRDGIRKVLGGIMDQRYFPVTFDALPSRLDVHEFVPGASFHIGSALVETCATHHPGGNVAYRITADGWTFLFTGDHESIAPDMVMANFLRGADVAVVDAQYTNEEYPERQGWGHSTFSAWPELAAAAGVQQLVFSHHDPSRTDSQLDAILADLRSRFGHLNTHLEMAAEGMKFYKANQHSLVQCIVPETAPGQDEGPATSNYTFFPWLYSFSRELLRYTDVGTLLDRILLEGRRVTRADAGTMYLQEGDQLIFANIHNDTLFPGSAAIKHSYANITLSVDTSSIAGYVALKRRLVNIPDMYALPEEVPFSFNATLDQATGYHTVSTLTVPVLGHNNRLLGVMQLINSKPHDIPTPFNKIMEIQVQLLAAHAGNAIERGILAQNLILRMLRMAALRDPYETGPHVQRVGSYAAEIYQCWAEKQGLDIDELRYTKGKIRLAAMLHDIGKVGIPDAILKKPGLLTDEERQIMQTHCSVGAAIFGQETIEHIAELDQLAQEAILHHHQKWDGSGYTGGSNPTLQGKHIPLVARITAIADVYDALSSRRCYKKAWSTVQARQNILQSAGTHFDPELVTCFDEIWDTIEAIRGRYPDEASIDSSPRVT